MELVVRVTHLPTGLPFKGSPGPMLLRLSTDHHNWQELEGEKLVVTVFFHCHYVPNWSC